MKLKAFFPIVCLVGVAFTAATYTSFNKVSRGQSDTTVRNVAVNKETLILRSDAADYDECSEMFDSEDLTETQLNNLEQLRADCIRERERTVTKTSAEGVQYPYLSELSKSLTPELEAQFDVFLVINTDNNVNTHPEDSTGNVRVPKQHVRVIVKKNRGTNFMLDNVFERDFVGNIVGINENNVDYNVPELAGLNEIPNDIAAKYISKNVPYLVPSTTGIASAMKTVNGLYLVNMERSISHRATSPEAPMLFQTYIDTRYRSGQQSGIAIHGTPSRFRHLLGVQRGSHGCARVHPTHARIINSFVMNLPKRQVQKLNWRSWLSYDMQSPPGPEMVASVPVMFVMFNGYDPILNLRVEMHKPVSAEPQKSFAQK